MPPLKINILLEPSSGMANLRTKILDLRGFGSSRVLILRDGILMPVGDFPEILSQRNNVLVRLHQNTRAATLVLPPVVLPVVLPAALPVMPPAAMPVVPLSALLPVVLLVVLQRIRTSRTWQAKPQ